LITLKIDNDALIAHTNTLEKISRSTMPVSARTALNSAAFYVKQKSMPSEAKKKFKERNKTFFKATSRVQMAQGFDVNKMRSIVGFVGGDKNQAVDNLEKQERGGSIGGRSFIPMKEARQGKSPLKQVKKANQLRNLKSVKKVQSRRDFYKTVFSVGAGGVILHKDTLFRVRRLKRGDVNLEPLYSYRKNRSVSVKSTSFMETATIPAAKRLETYYKIEARKQLKKYGAR
jgi:hypothetical protein